MDKTPANAIVVNIKGGLGNQMFQYAAGLTLARKNNARLILDLRFLLDRSPRRDFTYRDFDLNIFALAPDCEIAQTAEALPPGLQTVSQKHFHFDPAVLELSAGVYLDGYWQSPRYFAPVQDEIRKTFSSTATPLSPEYQKLADAMSAKNAVCLHVRRTDMVAVPKTAAFHGACSLSYFQETSAVMAKRYPDAHFYVFSDDIEWCKASGFLIGHPHTFVEHPLPGNHVTAVDLQLMMRCRHFIISNSSYGWWAAYLGSSAASTVIVPDPWFDDGSIDTADLLPESWIRFSKRPGLLPDRPLENPTVSVVIPCYKQAQYLQEAVASVVGQTYSDWELIIVNDGSPDDTSCIAQSIIDMNPGRRISLLEKPNGGTASTRNAGVLKARGKYILPLDADDRIHPQMLEKTVAILESRPDISIVYTDLLRFGTESGLVRADAYAPENICYKNQISYCSLYRRAMWEKVSGYNANKSVEEIFPEDWDFWVACAEHGFVAHLLSEPLFYYRIKTESKFTAGQSREMEIRAHIILNHPKLSSPEKQAWARDVFAALALSKAVHAEIAAALTQPEPLVRPKEAPVVSLLIPCYNQAEYLAACIESVVAQSFLHWEAIIINDGSSDNTTEVARELMARFPTRRIRLIEQENKGLSSARNVGMRVAEGRYLLPLDADDLIHPKMLTRMVETLDRHPEAAIAYCDYVYFGYRNETVSTSKYDFERLVTKENLFTCASLVRREAWEAVGGFNTNMAFGYEDWDFWIGCGERGYTGMRIPEFLFFYRSKRQSMITEVKAHFKEMKAQMVLNHAGLHTFKSIRKAIRTLRKPGKLKYSTASAFIKVFQAKVMHAMRSKC